MSNAFTEVNARAAVIGAALGEKLVKERDIEGLRQMRVNIEGIYNAMIDLIKTRPDYPAWHEMLLRTNVESPFNQLDTTGEFTKTVEELKTIDATGHYFSEVLPVIKRGIIPLITERDNMLMHIDLVISACIDARRSEITAV